MNHSVHSFINGCFTLKFSASWKTVTDSLADFAESTAVSSDDMFGSLLSLLGEIGIVSRGTGELGLGVASVML